MARFLRRAALATRLLWMEVITNGSFLDSGPRWANEPEGPEVAWLGPGRPPSGARLLRLGFRLDACLRRVHQRAEGRRVRDGEVRQDLPIEVKPDLLEPVDEG